MKQDKFSEFWDRAMEDSDSYVIVYMLGGGYIVADTCVQDESGVLFVYKNSIIGRFPLKDIVGVQ